MQPPRPPTRRARMSIAWRAAAIGSFPAPIRSVAVFASSTFMIDSPQPVVEQPPVWLSAYRPAPISGESPTRPGSLLAVPPVDVPVARRPARSSATQPTVSLGWGSEGETGRPGDKETGRADV